MLSRARVRFARIAVPNVPPQRVAAAIRLQMLQLSPWTNTGFAFRRGVDSAAVWYWDEDALTASLAAVGSAAGDVAPMPEPEFREGIAGDALLLVRCLDGAEGQIWRDGELTASMWWPTIPDQTAWAAFALDANIEPTAVPAMRDIQRTQPPRAGVSVQRALTATTASSEALAMRIAAAALGAYAIWLGIEHARVELVLRSVAQERAAIETRLGPVLGLRAQAERDANAAAQLLALRPPVTQADLLLAVAAVAGSGKALTLRDWDFRDDRLRIVLVADSDNYDRAGALAALARVPPLNDIQLAGDAEPNTLALIARVSGQTVPARTATQQ